MTTAMQRIDGLPLPVDLTEVPTMRRRTARPRRHPSNAPTGRKFDQALKGLSHEIFSLFFWPVWMHLDLYVNCFWFVHFNDAASTLDDYFKF